MVVCEQILKYIETTAKHYHLVYMIPKQFIMTLLLRKIRKLCAGRIFLIWMYMPVEIFVKPVKNESQQFLGVVLLKSVEAWSIFPNCPLKQLNAQHTIRQRSTL